jgi:small subunit ribosomal protein S9
MELPRKVMLEPLKIAGELANKVDIDVKVSGGGVMGQSEAVRTAIARGLVEFFGDEELKKAFLEYDRTLLVNDVRRKLPKVQGGRGARKRRQTSYR